jgi:hypothetical protein
MSFTMRDDHWKYGSCSSLPCLRGIQNCESPHYSRFLPLRRDPRNAHFALSGVELLECDQQSYCVSLPFDAMKSSQNSPWRARIRIGGATGTSWIGWPLTIASFEASKATYKADLIGTGDGPKLFRFRTRASSSNNAE